MTAMSMVTSTPLTDAAGSDAEGETVGLEEPEDGPQFGGAEEDNLCAAGCYAIVDTGTSGDCPRAVVRLCTKSPGRLYPIRDKDICTGDCVVDTICSLAGLPCPVDRFSHSPRPSFDNGAVSGSEPKLDSAAFAAVVLSQRRRCDLPCPACRFLCFDTAWLLITMFSCVPLAATLAVPGPTGIAVPEDYFYTLADEITEASGATCKGTTCYNAKGSDFPDLVRKPAPMPDARTPPRLALPGFMLCWRRSYFS